MVARVELPGSLTHRAICGQASGYPLDGDHSALPVQILDPSGVNCPFGKFRLATARPRVGTARIEDDPLLVEGKAQVSICREAYGGSFGNGHPR